MPLTFKIVGRNIPSPEELVNVAYLIADNWDDFGYKTLFTLTVIDEYVDENDIGSVKIGFAGQSAGWTTEEIQEKSFNALPENFFSLGQDANYYRNIVEKLSEDTAKEVLVALRDVADSLACMGIAEKEKVFGISLLRFVRDASIKHQFRRILRHEAPLTDYNFLYGKASSDCYSGIKVSFFVNPDEKPSSNIHVLIGRNGVGKTTLLNDMVDALLPSRDDAEAKGVFFNENATDKVDFAGVVSVSFSAFDPFQPPPDGEDPTTGFLYSYVGLKKRSDDQGSESLGLKDRNDLCNDFVSSIGACFSLTAKKARWLAAVQKLESDLNFALMDLPSLFNAYDECSDSEKVNFCESASRLFSLMSSGHAIVLLTITKLIETVEEKTLVLIDEPESHLHPPLLSAFTRALSDLLVDRNGVAIIATHSPVVLQEVPKSCVSILHRTKLVATVDKPEIETFAENVGILTREVFGLEVSKSGFHDLLAKSVADGKSFEEIAEEYHNQLGFEGRAILRSMILTRGSEEATVG